ncbi:MAG: 3H domain-containing protein, partial [Syntrophothermus sp.]
TEDELLTIVDYGGQVVDVTVEHPVYGELRGWLNIKSREDVHQFIRRLASSDAKPLLTLTDGVHLHKVEGADATVLERVEKALRAKGYLLEAR